MKLKRIHWLFVAVVLVALAAVGALPSFNFVHVSGPDGDVTVQQAGFGGIHVRTDTADIRVNRP
jgi:hypothetical protein